MYTMYIVYTHITHQLSLDLNRLQSGQILHVVLVIKVTHTHTHHAN